MVGTLHYNGFALKKHDSHARSHCAHSNIHKSEFKQRPLCAYNIKRLHFDEGHKKMGSSKRAIFPLSGCGQGFHLFARYYIPV